MASLTLRNAARKLPLHRPRLIAIDMDGTLLRTDHSLAPATIRAVEAARETGIGIVLASSRPPVGMLPHLRALGLTSQDPFIACQGGVVGTYDDDRLHVHAVRPIPLQNALSAVQIAKTAGVVTNWYTADEWFVDRVTTEIERQARILGVVPTVHTDLNGLPEPSKLLFITPSTSVSSALVEQLVGTVSAVTSDPTFVEVTASDVDKSLGVRFVAEELGVELADTVAIGDGRNDIAMFRSAGFAIAPANAGPDVADAADAVTASNDDDGVAAALDALRALPAPPLR